MLSGLIMFISIFKAEVFHKLRPSNMDPIFNFHYGHSFILYVLGFIAVELAGILNVCLYSSLQKAEESNQVRIGTSILHNLFKSPRETEFISISISICSQSRMLNNYVKPGHVQPSSTAINRHNHLTYPSFENG